MVSMPNRFFFQTLMAPKGVRSLKKATIGVNSIICSDTSETQHPFHTGDFLLSAGKIMVVIDILFYST